MTLQSQAVSDFQKATQHYIAGLPLDRGAWLTDHRWSAVTRFSDLGFPDKRQEAWRYTSIEGLLKQGFVTSDSDMEVVGTEFEHHFLDGPTAGRVVFVDGAFQPSLSDTHVPGVRINNLRSAMETSDLETLKSVGTLSGPGTHGFSALNMATMRDGALIRVSAGLRLDAPIDLVSISTSSASGRAMRPRHLIVLEQDAEATLVERYLSTSDNAYFTNLVCEVLLEERASLVHQRVQQESPSAYHLADLHIELQADASYRGVNLAIGGAWSRTKIGNSFAAPGASCELHGLYLAGEGQLVDFHLDVDHGVPGCDSRENFRGILYGNGRAVFDGRILVQKQAQKSSAHLSNANLMLSRRAEIDTKPQLEILADDVMCSHGTTVGQIDPQALFYLRSRGLSEERARRLLCLGFASEILEQFESGSLQDHLAELIQQKIGSETKGAS